MPPRPHRGAARHGPGVHVVAGPNSGLRRLAAELRACRLCAGEFAALGHAPRPVARLSSRARICICAQAPGARVHATGLSFNDRSGDRLRGWLGVDAAQFYDARRIAIVPMAFCFPGQDARGGDRPPPPVCARQWRRRLFERMPQLELLLLIGLHAQRWHLGDAARGPLAANMADWRGSLRRGRLPLPHPSWRNNGWLRAHPWFEAELLPALRRRVRRLLA